DQQLHALEEQPVGKGERDLLRLQVLLQHLDGGVVAARLVADRDWHTPEVSRAADRRVRRHEDPGRRDRIGIGIELAVTARRSNAHRPMAGAGNIAAAAALESLVGAYLVAEIVPLALARDQLVAELVIE